jgi:hypothetical protein
MQGNILYIFLVLRGCTTSDFPSEFEDELNVLNISSYFCMVDHSALQQGSFKNI